MKVFEGKLVGKGLKFGIAVSRFNEMISERLLSGAIDSLKRHDVDENNIDVAWVPGSFEMPLAAQEMADSGRYDAVICLGAIIRGGTPHFEYIASEAAKGIAQISMSKKLPVIFGIITADTIEQAVERAGTKAGNKGADAAVTAVEMANLMLAIRG